MKQHLWTVEVEPDDIVRLKWTDGLVVTPEIASTAIAEVDERCGGRPHRMLIDMDGATVTRRARMVFVADRSSYAVALLGQSAVDRIVAAFVTGVMSPPMPLRFFSGEAEALSWLRSARDDAA